MLLDELKILIKDFEGILSKDLRFKEDMYFKNQVKIIYGEKEKIKNVFVPLMLANLSKTEPVDEVTKLKDRIKYLEKIESMPEEPHVCPKVEPQDCSKCKTHVCPTVEPHVCPPCNCPKYETDDLPESDTIRKAYNDVTRHIETTASEEDDLNILYTAGNGRLKLLPIKQQVQSIKELIPERVKNRTDAEIKLMIQKYQ